VSVLSAAQSAGIRLLGVRPGSLFSTTDAFALELAELATEAAVAIATYYDWQKLKLLATYTGDGATIAFPMPGDYGRMPKKAAVHSQAWQNSNFRQARDEDEFLYLQDVAISGAPGVWILLGGRMQIFPAMPVGETARHYYISNKIVAPSAGADGTKTAFAADADCFVLSERLLTLALIWRWRAQKRMEYSEDMANYEIALSEEVAADKGQRIITVGRQRLRSDITIAYPGTIVP
jgi:hypothetical protein